MNTFLFIYYFSQNFTRNDENFVEAFAIFCGMGIHNTHMYEKAIVAMAKQSVTLEVLSYHASATVDDAGRLKVRRSCHRAHRTEHPLTIIPVPQSLKIPSAAHFQLHDFKFDDLLMDDDDTLRACLRMFLDMDFVNRFHIDYEVLCRWLLSVKKNYRNVTYHNWRHAFNVAQMMFSILTVSLSGIDNYRSNDTNIIILCGWCSAVSSRRSGGRSSAKSSVWR